MSRRQHYFVSPCAEDGCQEADRVFFDTLRDRDKHARYRYEHPYRCQRHARPDEVLSEANPRREIVYTVADDRGRKAWTGGRNNHPWIGGGFDDFQAYAKDFPVGTKLKITLELGDS